MSTSTIDRNRQPKGTPVGGQFAAGARAGADASVTLADPDLEPAADQDDSPFRKRYDTFEEKIEVFREELERGIENLRSDTGWVQYLRTMTKFHNYSANNQIMIAIQNPDATRVAGYNRWQDVGRQVKKGERGLVIWAPKTRVVEETDAAGNPRRGADGKILKTKKVVGFTTATVFDITQTEGEELPEVVHKLTAEPPAGYIEDLTAAIEEAGYTVSYDEIGGGTNGYTSPEGKVVIDSRLSMGQRAKTLSHELGHIKMGHMEPDRMGEYHTGHGGQRGAMECEAESFAYVMCRANGMESEETGGYSFGYVAGWGGAEGTELVKKSADTLSKAVKSTLSSRTWVNVAPDPVADAPRKERAPRKRKAPAKKR